MPVTGLGIDMIEVERVAAKISKESGFRELVFSESEIKYCEAQTHKFEHYAARFAAKEAFFKALGSGWKNGTSFNEIEIVHDENRKPEIRLLGKTAETVGEINISVSITHVKTMAAAVVIIETLQ